MTKEWLTQGEIDDRIRQRVADQLSREIASYDGSPAAAKEILRGLAAAHMMEIDMHPFEDALAERHRALGAA